MVDFLTWQVFSRYWDQKKIDRNSYRFQMVAVAAVVDCKIYCIAHSLLLRQRWHRLSVIFAASMIFDVEARILAVAVAATYQRNQKIKSGYPETTRTC